MKVILDYLINSIFCREYSSMRFMNKKYFILLAGLLVLTSALDPVLHEYSDDLVYESECQLCSNEISKEVQPLTIKNIEFKLSHMKVEKVDDFVSVTPKNFYSRAPPKI
ncbi:MAG: hypothetical protein ACJ0F4_03825 [Gammaproteobacteria bacterium]